MKITIDLPPFSYSANWDHENKIEKGFFGEYNVPVAEAVDAALTLLSKVFILHTRLQLPFEKQTIMRFIIRRIL